MFSYPSLHLLTFFTFKKCVCNWLLKFKQVMNEKYAELYKKGRELYLSARQKSDVSTGGGGDKESGGQSMYDLTLSGRRTKMFSRGPKYRFRKVDFTDDFIIFETLNISLISPSRAHTQTHHIHTLHTHTHTRPNDFAWFAGGHIDCVV